MFYWGGATPRRKSHDYAILKSLFKPVESSWFNNHHIKVDLGFLGIAKDYLCKKLSIPHKKSQKKPLTNEQKLENKTFASERIKVEQSIRVVVQLKIKEL